MAILPMSSYVEHRKYDEYHGMLNAAFTVSICRSDDMEVFFVIKQNLDRTFCLGSLGDIVGGNVAASCKGGVPILCVCVHYTLRCTCSQHYTLCARVLKSTAPKQHHQISEKILRVPALLS